MMEAGSKIWICLLLLVFYFTSCKQEIKVQKTKEESQAIQYELVSDTVIYNLLNNVLLFENDIYKECPNLLNRNPEAYSNINDELLESLDSIFSKEDIAYIKTQYKKTSNLVWDKTKLKDKIIVDANLLESSDSDPWKAIEDFYAEVGCFSVIQIPIFNLKKDIAIIEVQYNYAMDWGKFEAYIYKRTDSGKWEKHSTIFKLVS